MSAARTGALGVGLAKGELYTLDANGELVRVAAGTTGQVLAADSTLAEGMGWLYPITSKFDPVEQANSFGNLRGRNVANAASFNTTFYVPDDFQSLVAVYFCFIAGGDVANKNWSFTTNYSIPGQIQNTHVAGPTSIAYSTSGSFNTAVDFSSLYAATPLVANTMVGLSYTNVDGGSTMTVLGVVLKYRRKAL